ncbi:MAG: single-stranded-DNA-specific exonuclease RecJ, partial [Gammaproteobacteria bacterium]|nr:single-stranded-DNA-specific exonuclease RecJ [Gammaproteobacteria bacterium]
GIECLLNDDPRNAAEQARALDAFNQERRVVEADMQEDALEILNSLNEEASLPFGLCLFDEHWHEGVIGILASRIKERLHRPVIVFTGTQEQNEEIKGSARSVPGVHIRDVLSNLSARYPDLIGKFGGHAMAAGLSLPRGNLEEFKRAFDQEVRRSLKPEDLEGVVYSDGSLSASDFSLELAKELNAATPWGQGFPAPVFDGRFVLLGRRLLKGCHLKMRLQPEDSDTSVEAIAFNTADTEWPVNTTRVTLVYRLEVNLYRGVKTLQLLAEYVEAEA